MGQAALMFVVELEQMAQRQEDALSIGVTVCC